MISKLLRMECVKISMGGTPEREGGIPKVPSLEMGKSKDTASL